LLAGLIANRIFHLDAKLPMFKFEIAGLLAFLLIVAFAPLAVFAPHLAAARRAGLYRYGRLAHEYTAAFENNWIRGAAPPADPLLGTPDIQSLADLASSYDIIRQMQPLPFGRRTVISLAVLVLLPLSPLILTVIPLETLAKRLLLMFL